MQRDRKFILLIVFLIFGMVLAMQFRSTLKTNTQKSNIVNKIEDYKRWLKEEKDKVDALTASVADNEIKNEEYLKLLIDDKNSFYLKNLKESIDDIKLKAGLTDVKGAGIIVKLNDAEVRKKNVLVEDIIIHDKDIVLILNELKKAGAQAISINNERVIATSEQICAGPTVRINKRRYAVPYEIKAIGDPEELFANLDGSTIAAILRRYDIRVDISKSKEIIIPKLDHDSDKLKSLISGLEVIEQ